MSRWMETGCRSRVWRPRPTSTTRSFSSACSWLPSGSWPASGRCSRTKGMTPRVIALSAATWGSSPRSTRVGSHTDRDWASAAGQSSAATPGCLRTSAWPSAMIGLGSSSNRCCRAHAYSWLQDASPENSEDRLLGNQTEGEFSTTKVVSGKTFANIFGLKGLAGVVPDPETKVHICTIQGLVRRVLYQADTSDAPPVDQYDLMVIDECHRGYLLDRELSDAELTFRGQEDYISKYRRVLEYFDATKIGFTATPALHTTEIFGDPIYTYSYRDAVIDGYLIDHEPPIRIETALTRSGIAFSKDEELEVLNTRTGEVDLTHAPDEIRFEVDQFNRQVITEEFNRVVAKELAQHIDPALPGKTLIFAAANAHADIVVEQFKKALADRY